jgi:hypothetical protein
VDAESRCRCSASDFSPQYLGFQFGGENSRSARVIYGVGAMRSAKTTILSS